MFAVRAIPKAIKIYRASNGKCCETEHVGAEEQRGGSGVIQFKERVLLL